MKAIAKIGCLLLFIASVSVRAQTPFGFYRRLDIPVHQAPGATALPNAWAGGLNAPQISELDINGDMQADLLVFDRSGDKVLPFIRSTNGYIWRAEYAALFPEEEHWMLAKDYDGDGLKDLFCSAGQGIRVYRNVSVPGKPVAFELVSSLLFSDYGNGLLNLFVNQIDLPAIADLDGDGDLDILTFYILGTCVEFHRNMSLEKFGHRDSLVFELASDNWGLFTEDALSNGVNLNDSCDKYQGGGLRHTGSSLFADDPDKDGDPDLFLGDISYAELHLLINEKQNEKDVIISHPQHYPAAYSQFSQPNFPAAFRLEDAGNGLPGLVICPNTDHQAISADSVCKIYTSLPGPFLYTQTPHTFLSDQMIDAGKLSIPVLADIDRDGDFDLVLGNAGNFIPSANQQEPGKDIAHLYLYLNTGNNTHPEFTLVTHDLANLASLNLSYLAPAIADINGDQLPDLLVGKAAGGFLCLLRKAPVNEFNFQPDNGWFGQLISGIEPVPCLTDIDMDGDQDLICGSRSGYFNFFENTGSPQLPAFANTATLEQLGAIETIDESKSNYGYSSPAFFRHNNRNWLFSGSESGKFHLWDIGTPPFENEPIYVASDWLNTDAGKRSTIALADFNADGFPELVCGNYRGGLEYFSGVAPSFTNQPLASNLKISPNPANDYLSWHLDDFIESKQFEVLDIAGRSILSGKTIAGENRLNISALQPGLYVLKLNHTSPFYKPRFLKID